jgi:hypothetical protein
VAETHTSSLLGDHASEGALAHTGPISRLDHGHTRTVRRDAQGVGACQRGHGASQGVLERGLAARRETHGRHVDTVPVGHQHAVGQFLGPPLAVDGAAGHRAGPPCREEDHLPTRRHAGQAGACKGQATRLGLAQVRAVERERPSVPGRDVHHLVTAAEARVDQAPAAQGGPSPGRTARLGRRLGTLAPGPSQRQQHEQRRDRGPARPARKRGRRGRPRFPTGGQALAGRDRQDGQGGLAVDSRPLARADPAVAAPRQGLDEAGRIGLVAQRRAHTPDAEVDALLEVDEGAVAPQLALDLLTREEAAWMRGQQAQQLERLRLQARDGARLAQLLARQVELEHAKAQQALARRWR